MLEQQPRIARFYLDESLPCQVAQALRLVHYPITDPLVEGLRGLKDPHLIPWLGENDLTWILKDDAARRDHLDDIIKHELCTIWVRGIDRKQKHQKKIMPQRNKISPRELHLMLAYRLPPITAAIERAHGPRHFMLYMNAAKPTYREFLDLEELRLKGTKQLA